MRYKGLLILLVIFLSFVFLNEGSSSNSSSSFHSQISKTDSAKSLRALEKDIDDIVDRANLKATKFSVAVYSLDTRQFYYKKNIAEMLTPASLTKIFTCFSAYYRLKSNYKVTTDVYTNGNISGGVLNGDLILVGHGDALLSFNDIKYLSNELKKQGIAKVNGTVFSDGAFFDDVNERVQYSGDRDVVQATPPITALSLEQNVVTVTVKAGEQTGKPVLVETTPASDAFKIISSAKVTGGSYYSKPARKSQHGANNSIRRKSRTHAEFYGFRDFGYGGHSVPHRQYTRRRESSGGISVSTKPQPDGTQAIYVNGSLEAGKTYSYKYFVHNPVMVAAGALKRALTENGISISGGIGIKNINVNKGEKELKLLASFSRPLPDIISPLMKNSDNYLAETIFKIIGASANKLTNTAKESRLLISQALDSAGANCEECSLNDGSGLSRRNKVNTECLVKMLNYAYHSDFYKSIDTCLSIGGVDGTLKNRFIGTLAENNLHAKTGTHSNVSGLAGYVRTLDGEKIAFAIISNGGNIGNYKQLENEIGTLLAQFFYFNVEK